MEVTSIKTSFEIPAENMAALREKIQKLNRRAKRIRCAPISMIEGESFQKKVSICVGEDEEGRPEYRDAMITFVKVEIVGEAPVIPGFTFIGTIDHLPTGMNVLRIIQGYTADERFRNIEQVCEHCNTRRRRKDTYIVQDASGVQKQIGRSCLKDFTGHKSPESIASMAEMLADFLEEMNGFSEYGYTTRERFGLQLAEHLAWGSFAIRKFGWVSGKTAFEHHIPSTKSHIYGLKDAYKKSKSAEDCYTKKDEEVAAAVIEWVRGVEADSDYLKNLKAIFSMDAIEERSSGLVISAIPQYHRALEKEMEAKKFISQKNSKHVGTIGERQEFTVTVLGVSHVDSQFGTMNIHRMITPEGNVLTAFSMPEDLTVGQQYRIKATVKRHDIWKEISQTVVNRPKILESIKIN